MYTIMHLNKRFPGVCMGTPRLKASGAICEESLQSLRVLSSILVVLLGVRRSPALDSRDRGLCIAWAIPLSRTVHITPPDPRRYS